MGGNPQIQALLQQGLLPFLAKKLGVNMTPRQTPPGGGQSGGPNPNPTISPARVPGQQQQPQQTMSGSGGGGSPSPFSIQSDPRSKVGNFNAPTAQPIADVHSLEQLIVGFNSRKQQKQQAEASNAAQALMQAIEGAKTTGDWTPAYDILHENEKLFNKVYKGWLQKAETQKKQAQGQEKSDPDVQGFESGVQNYMKGKQKPQAPGPPPQGSAPTSLGGYQLPAASPQQAMGQQAVSAEQQAQKQDPNRALGSQLSSGEQRQAELTKTGMASTPAMQAKLQEVAMGLRKAQLESQKAETELKIAEANAFSSKEKAQVSLDTERAKSQKALVDLDIARARLQTEIARRSRVGATKQPPTALTTRLNATQNAEDFVKGLIDQKAKSFSTNDVTKLQQLLTQGGASSLAKSLPTWWGSRWFSGEKDIQGLYDNIKSYKSGLEETIKGFGGAPAAKETSSEGPDSEDDDTMEDAEPEVGDEVTYNGATYRFDGKQYVKQDKKPQ